MPCGQNQPRDRTGGIHNFDGAEVCKFRIDFFSLVEIISWFFLSSLEQWNLYVTLLDESITSSTSKIIFFGVIEPELKVQKRENSKVKTPFKVPRDYHHARKFEG